MLKILLPVGVNFVARWRNFCCPSFLISLPVVFHSVTRGFSRRYPWFFTPLPVVFHADGRENLGHAEMGENKKKDGKRKTQPILC